MFHVCSSLALFFVIIKLYRTRIDGPEFSFGVVRFQAVMAVSMKMTALWDMASFSLMEVCPHFRGAYCLHRQFSG